MPQFDWESFMQEKGFKKMCELPEFRFGYNSQF